MAQPDLALSDLPAFPFEGMTGLDAFTLYAELRERDPVRPVRVASGGCVYLVARYEDARRVFNDPVFSRVALQREDVTVLIPASRIPGTMLNMDPPDHTRTRTGCGSGWRSRCPPAHTLRRRSTRRWDCSRLTWPP